MFAYSKVKRSNSEYGRCSSILPTSRKRTTQELLEAQVAELSALQHLHYAADCYAVLLIFQAMDAAGKDGAIRHVMSGVNPQGCQVFSFKHPSTTELEHDLLWRTSQCLPERGHIGIFNRSYYEEVLIVRVHPEILRSQGLPDQLIDEKSIWKGRYRSIVNLEQHRYRNGMRVINFSFTCHRRSSASGFWNALTIRKKNWKFSLADMQERKFWKHYQRAYEACLSATSTKMAPWYVVPADDKENARLIISRIVLDTFKALKLRYPESDAARRQELASIREQLRSENAGGR